MRYRSLGSSGLKLSVIALGTMIFDGARWGCDGDTATRLIHRFLDGGGNLVDTADVYGDGRVERLIGKAVAGRRHQVLIATKFGGFTGPGINDGGNSRHHVLDAVDQSLRRLGTDHIDLLQIHAHDATTPMEETLRALDDVVRTGRVRYIGCSNMAAWQLVKAAGLARHDRLTMPVSLQVQYSLIARHIEREHVPACLDAGIGLLAWSPLGAGLLAGRAGSGRPPAPDVRLGFLPRAREGLHTAGLAAADAVIAAAAEAGLEPAQVALAWLLSRPAVCAAIAGVRTEKQLDIALDAADCRLPADMLASLDTHGRPRPVSPYDTLDRVEAQWPARGHDRAVSAEGARIHSHGVDIFQPRVHDYSS
ncbi:aldo/keto reductase [Tistrella sp. BH-R2-4]|uniref:Aldo/keto reductase n=1 Tax=Tistrella arctica TaxID=3133430 RepID=A0ABU9YLT3_9PROT